MLELKDVFWLPKPLCSVTALFQKLEIAQLTQLIRLSLRVSNEGLKVHHLVAIKLNLEGLGVPDLLRLIEYELLIQIQSHLFVCKDCHVIQVAIVGPDHALDY